MSLVREIAQAIAKRGPSTTNDVARLFPDLPRKTVQKALGNAKTMGLVVSDPEPKSGGGQPTAVYVATARATDAPPPRNGYVPKSGSNMMELEGLIDEYGPCTIDSILKYTSMTKEQAQSAASNLATEKRICIAERGVRHGRAEDRRPSTYRIVERLPERGGQFWQRKVSSVFDLGRVV